MLELVVAFAVGLILVYIILKILSIPMKLLWKFLTNSIIGAIMLYVVSFFGVPVIINVVTALIAGVFGIPGVIAVVVYSLM